MLSYLATKLNIPAEPSKRVARIHILQRLNEGLELNRQITLVSAPAGYGKTTCITAWAHSLDHWPVSWLSLDPSDDDPRRFFGYFIAALQKVDASLGQEIADVIRSGQLPPDEIISTTLLNDISRLKSQFLLVLDDFHGIQDRLILDVLEHIVTNLPQPVHLVIITREDPPLPLARLRANNQLTEIRARDLRFSPDDTNRFLHEVMGLSLSQADIAVLEGKTEGWIAGLQLAAITLKTHQTIQDLTSPSRFIAQLSGSHRFILSYLTEQVLQQQPDEIQDFLLKTSILDKLNGDLCNAVTRRSDSDTLLEQMFTANLFLIPLDDERQWYRYHHLFADLLRELQHTKIEDLSDLHQRASHWYTQAGMVNEAIQHALAAKDYALAVELLESRAMEMIMQGYAKTVNGWVEALPEDWRAHSPRTSLAFAWALSLRGAYTQVSEHLDRLRKTLFVSPPNDVDPLLQAEWLVLQSLQLYKQGKLTECTEMATQALALTSEVDHRIRSLAFYAQASVAWFREDDQQAGEIFRKSIQESRAAENLVAEMMSTASLTNIALERGQLHLAFEIASQAVERIEHSGLLPPISALIYTSLGDVYYQWNQLTQARQNFQRALHLSLLGGSNTITILCRVLLSRLSLLEGDLDAALGEIQKADALLPVDAPEYVRQEVASQQARVYLALDRPAAAEMALQGSGFTLFDQPSASYLPSDQATLIPNENKISASLGLLYNSALRVLLYQVRSEDNPALLKSGVEFANRVVAGSTNSHQLLITLESLLLRGQMYALLGDHPACLADYEKALGLAAPEGFLSVFVESGLTSADLAELVSHNELEIPNPDIIKQILEALSTEPPVPNFKLEAAQEALIEPLTGRDLDVLRCMAEGLKYKEIAAELFITQNTVRYHIKAIYGKLIVNNRTQAIEKARQLQIL